MRTVDLSSDEIEASIATDTLYLVPVSAFSMNFDAEQLSR